MGVFELSSGDDVFPSRLQDVSGNDTVLGLAGDDRLNGGRGNDNVDGGAGNDTLESLWSGDLSTGADRLDGGAGDDVIFAAAVEGPLGIAAEDDTVMGGAGNDVLYGGVSISGGAGDDTVFATTGSAAILAGAGNDRVTARYDVVGTTVMTLSGGVGRDSLILDLPALPGVGAALPVTLSATGAIRIDGLVRLLVGGFEEVSLRTDADQVTLHGGQERDLFQISGDIATVRAGGGRDVVTVDYAQRFDGGVYTLDGGRGDDVLRVTADVQNGAAIYLDWATGLARIGSKGDSHFSHFERLDLLGSAGNDTVFGGSGVDVMAGSFGNDQMLGNDGDDSMSGGFGADSMTGGGGADVFLYSSENDSNTAFDRISGFAVGAGTDGDRIDLSAIDGNRTTAGQEHLVFVGLAAFSQAGQVRVEQSGADCFVWVNTDADAAAEMKIILLNFAADTMGAADFIL